MGNQLDNAFWWWIASYGKIRKDELFGFLEFAIPHIVVELEQTLQHEINIGRIEVGQYQKISFADDLFNKHDFVPLGIREVIALGIPPMLLAAFLRNQGIATVDNFVSTLTEMLEARTVMSNGKGILVVEDTSEYANFATNVLQECLYLVGEDTYEVYS